MNLKISCRNVNIIIFLLVTFLDYPARADCIDPFHLHVRGSIEAGSYKLNTHAEGSVLCIMTTAPYCRDCKVGSAYECREDRWRLNPENECGLKKTSRIARMIQ
ncbi:hypothetical protein EV561_104310 [Rhizobium sp. BK376]|jgi:hypothetical protein|nr:hypothetical protein EV561_104310 [Rhizobium sp. BK376]